jgi:hypothetical protein
VRAKAELGANGVVWTKPEEWGGDLALEARVCAEVVQTAAQVCLDLASKMKMAEESLGKEMSADDTQAGMSVIKAGDSTPVTAADFAIQAIVAEKLKKAFPNDRFMGEEDAADLREDPALRAMTVSIAKQHVHLSEDEILAAIDSGVEPPREQGERVWVLDPIDGALSFSFSLSLTLYLSLWPLSLSPSLDPRCSLFLALFRSSMLSLSRPLYLSLSISHSLSHTLYLSISRPL